MHQQPSPPNTQPEVHTRFRPQIRAIDADPRPTVHAPPKQGWNGLVEDPFIRAKKSAAVAVSVARRKNAR